MGEIEKYILTALVANLILYNNYCNVYFKEHHSDRINAANMQCWAAGRATQD